VRPCPQTTRRRHRAGILLTTKRRSCFRHRFIPQCFEAGPTVGNAHLHLGTAHLLQGELEKATLCFEQLLKLEPDSAEARAFLGLIHLKQGNFRQGFPEYESRWSTPYGLRFRRTLSQPLWKGEPLDGSRILLHAEQGMGTRSNL